MSLQSSDVQRGLYFGGGLGTAIIATFMVLASMFMVPDGSKKTVSLFSLFLSFGGIIMLLILIYSRDPIPNMDLAIAQTVTAGLIFFAVLMGMTPLFKDSVGNTLNSGTNRCDNTKMIHGLAILMIAVQLNLLLLYKPFVELY
jgi:hypothetical protein